MDNRGGFNNELTRAATHSCYKVSRNLIGLAEVPPIPLVSLDGAKGTRWQAYTDVEGADVPLNAITVSPAEQREHIATLKRRLNASAKDMRTLFDCEEQRIVVTNTAKEVIVYTLLAVPLLAADVGPGYASRPGADVILNITAEITPR